MNRPGDVTIATYEAHAETYRSQTAQPGAASIAFLDAVAALVGTGHVLELGSGTGLGARLLEERGVRVSRTDATRAFVEMMRADGHDARLLDARTAALGGPYDGVVADAVLLHLDRAEFADLLRRARAAVRDDGLLALTLKEGDGSAWSEAKLGAPRHFTYWREGPLRAVLERTGWSVVSLDHVQGKLERWLYVTTRAAPPS